MGRQATGDALGTGDDQNGVIARDAAQDAGKHGVIDGARQQLRGACGRAHDHLVPGALGGHQQVGAPARQARGRVLGHGAAPRGRRTGRVGADLAGSARLGNRVELDATGSAHLGGAQLDEIARERGLGGGHPPLGQGASQLGLRPDALPAQDLHDETVACRLGGG